MSGKKPRAFQVYPTETECSEDDCEEDATMLGVRVDWEGQDYCIYMFCSEHALQAMDKEKALRPAEAATPE